MEIASPSPLVAPPTGTARAEAGALLRLAVPLVGANLLQMAIAAVDVIFVAQLGSVALAAATLGAYLFNLLVYALLALSGAASPLIAAELGRRAHAVREVRLSFRMAMWAGLVSALPIMLLLAQGEALFRAMGQDALVSAQAGAFLRVILVGLPLAVAAGIMRNTAATLGRPGWIFPITALALLLDIIGNWIFVFGRFGMPPLGLLGSAIANLIAFAAMALAYVAVLLGDRKLRRYRLFGYWWRANWPRFGDIIRLGLPVAVTWTLEGGLFSGAAILMGLIGVNDVAAHAIALNIAAFAFQLPFGIAQASTIRVGMAFGTGDRAWIARAGNVALVIGIGVMVATALAMWIAPRALIALYVDGDRPDDVAVAMLARKFLMVAAVFQIADGAQAVAAGVLRGLQDTRVPMFIALFGYWALGFGSSVILGFWTPLAGVGVWWGLAAGLTAVAVLLLIRWNARARLGLLPASAGRRYSLGSTD